MAAKLQESDEQMTRWLEILYEFDIDIQHRPGTKHSNADRLSRLPCRQCEHYNERRDKHVVHSAVYISSSESEEIKKGGCVVKSICGQWK